MTEEEAKTKWCPQMASHAMLCDETERHGDYHGGITAARCIGSACMAWRWHYSEITPDDEYTVSPTSVQVDHGYCGLAGKP